MASISFDTSELNALAADLIVGGVRVGAATAARLRTSALEIETLAQQLVPVRTGTLQSSISVTITGDGRSAQMEAEIGPTTPYGIYQEYGTSVMAPQPFMGPALEARAGAFVMAVEAAAAAVL